MTNNTISLPDCETLNLNNDTAAFSCLTPRAASVAFSIFQAINLIYHFRPRSQWWALHILSRQAGEAGGFEARHKQWCGLWPHLSDAAVQSKVSVYNRRLKEDQLKIGFRFINIKKQKPVRKDDGSYVGLPTFYGEGDFWEAFHHVQDQYLEIDLLALPRVERLARYITIIEVWGEHRNYKPITREKKEKSEKSQKEKSASLPCRCDCPTCAFCVVKNPTASEAALAKGVTGGRVTKELVEARLHSYAEALLECGQDWMSLGLKFQDFNRKLQTDYDDLLNRLRSAVVRSNKPGLKLVGGQPK